MMGVVGKLYECSMCGKTEFSKSGTGFDGEPSVYATPLPDGWGYIDCGSIAHCLCRTCKKKVSDAVDAQFKIKLFFD